MRTIVIVGGGFCGTALATMLLRRPPAMPSRLVLIERGAHVGRGVAFAARDFPYLLNVPACRMSANPADPLEFIDARAVAGRRKEAKPVRLSTPLQIGILLA